MHYVYILKDDDDKLYIGYSLDLKRRIKEHLQNKVFTTKKMKNPKIYYYEAYSSEKFAKGREKRLKQFGSSYSGLKKRIGLK